LVRLERGRSATLVRRVELGAVDQSSSVVARTRVGPVRTARSCM
jgi:hypothetical protein